MTKADDVQVCMLVLLLRDDCNVSMPQAASFGGHRILGGGFKSQSELSNFWVLFFFASFLAEISCSYLA